MRDVSWTIKRSGEQYQLTLRGHCDASPETVYDVLADLTSHREWGGEDQLRLFRLQTLDAPSHAAHVGDEFESTGRIFLIYRTLDRSTVTVADRPTAFAFRTENLEYVGRCQGTYENHYAVQPAPGGGSLVTYTFRRTRLVHPPLHLRPPVKVLLERVFAPRFFGRGFRNLLAAAEAHVPQVLDV